MKNLKILIIIFSFILITFIVGCLNNDDVNYDEQILGTWFGFEYPTSLNNSIPLQYTWTFFNNNSMESITYFENDTINKTLLVWFEFNIDNENICIKFLKNESSNDNEPICFLYSFSKDKKSLKLYNEDFNVTFNKIN